MHVARGNGFRAVIVSADKDLSQLLGDHDEQWDFARNQRWGAAGVHERHGVQARQIADYLALTGDAVDNIPGVPGIGAKTAAALLAHFDTLDALLARVEEVPYLRLRGAASAAAKLRAAPRTGAAVPAADDDRAGCAAGRHQRAVRARQWRWRRPGRAVRGAALRPDDAAAAVPVGRPRLRGVTGPGIAFRQTRQASR